MSKAEGITWNNKVIVWEYKGKFGPKMTLLEVSLLRTKNPSPKDWIYYNFIVWNEKGKVIKFG